MSAPHVRQAQGQPAQPAQPAQPVQGAAEAPERPEAVEPVEPVEPIEVPVPPAPPAPPVFEGITVQPGMPPFIQQGPSEEMVRIISMTFFLTVIVIALGVPLIRALSRKWERQAAAPTPSPDVERRLERIERAVEAVALEVERIGEGQRFTNQIVSELRALPSGDAAAAERAALERAAAPRERAR